jgi:hypothetical protein
MSQITQVNIIKDSFQNITSYFRKRRFEGFIMPINENWTAFFVSKNIIDNISKELSIKYSPCLHFLSLEDHGWGYTIFQNGNIVEKSFINYDFPEESSIDNTAFTLLKDLCENQNSFFELLKIINKLSTEKKLIDTPSIFLNALCMNSTIVNGLNYEILANFSSKDLKGYGITSMNQTQFSFNEFVVTKIGEYYNNQGFTTFHSDEEKSVSFIKSINGYYYSLRFDISSKNYLLVQVFMPFSSRDLNEHLEKEGFNKVYPYNNQYQLEQLIQQHGKSFAFELNNLFNKNRIEVNNIRGNISDFFDILLLSNGYKKLNITIPLEIIYDKEYMRICIVQPEGIATLEVSIIVNSRKILLSDALKILNIIKSDELNLSFKTEQDLIQVLKKIEYYLSIILPREIELIMLV